MAKALFSKEILTTTNTGFFFKMKYTRGPRILCFFIPNGNFEMRGSWVQGTVYRVKLQNESKSFQRSTFCSFFYSRFSLKHQFQVKSYMFIEFLIKNCNFSLGMLIFRLRKGHKSKKCILISWKWKKIYRGIHEFWNHEMQMLKNS